jgi:hypothetical protein
MATSVTQVITEARGLLQDVAGVRYSTTDLVQYLNDALDLLAEQMPALFYEYTAHLCAAGSRQTFSKVNSKGIVSVMETTAGIALPENDKDALDTFYPSWRTKTKVGVATAWMRIPGEKFTFDVYPPSAANQSLKVQNVYCRRYGPVDLLDERLTTYTSLLVDYMVGMCEAREAEEVGPQRTQLFMASFMAKLKALK